MTKIFKPVEKETVSVFLAGSIEMNKAVRWQDRVQNELSGYNINIYNPRREDWNSDWKQSISEPAFVEQVAWEVRHIEKADIVYFYIDPNTMSPITLWELGLMMKHAHKIIVCCPEGYWRKGNIDVYSKIFGYALVDNFEVSMDLLKQKVERLVY